MVEVREEEGGLAFVFSGKMDTMACLEVEKDVMARVHAAKGAVAFDLAGVDFVVSMFLRLCIQTCKELGPGRFRIVNADPAVRKVFTLAGLDGLMTIE